MDKFIIHGGTKLRGEVTIDGSKNAALPLMTAALLAPGKTLLRRVPKINDVKMMAHLLRVIGARVDHDEHTMEIDATHCSFCEAPYELVSKMRASIYVLGPLLARFGKARVSFPGGCAIGTRPVDLHLMAMEKLGAKIDVKKGYILAEADGLKGAVIEFPKVSVGATGNLLMAAVLADGETVIRNAALEPEITDLVDFLCAMGAKISGRDTTELVVHGVKELHPVKYDVIPDRIEAGTMLIAAAITRGEVTVKRCNPIHVKALTDKLAECGCQFDFGPDWIRIKPSQTITPADVVTTPYPGFPTDLQAQYMALMAVAKGSCVIEDTVFPDRFMHVAELNRLEADIVVESNRAKIVGVPEMSGAEVMATDLRASASLVIAGLAARGETTVSRIYHIDRGYHQIEKKLKLIGADIERIQG